MMFQDGRIMRMMSGRDLEKSSWNMELLEIQEPIDDGKGSGEKTYQRQKSTTGLRG